MISQHCFISKTCKKSIKSQFFKIFTILLMAVQQPMVHITLLNLGDQMNKKCWSNIDWNQLANDIVYAPSNVALRSCLANMLIAHGWLHSI